MRDGGATTGYGVLSNENENLNRSRSSVDANSFSPAYGSLNNSLASVSTTDSFNRWYVEGYENEHDIDSAYTARGTPRQGTLYNEYFESYTSDHLPDGMDPQFVTNIQGVQAKDFEAFKTNGLASTPLVAWNLTNLLLSTSLLAFPFVVYQAGYIVLPLTFLIAFTLNYTSCILIDMMYKKIPELNYQKVRVRRHITDLGREVFNSENGAKFVQMIQVIEMLCICILNICVLGQLAHEITGYNIKVCTAFAALLAFFPTFFIRKLVIIGWFQTIGVASLSIGIILIQGWCLAHVEKFKPDNIPVVQWHKLPVAIGVIVYAYGIHGVLPGVEEQMRKPKQFGRVITWTFSVSIFLQCFFSVTNAMYYGKKTTQVIVIDMNDHFELGIVSACFIGISILSHFSLPMLVVMESLDNSIVKISSSCSSSRQAIDTLLIILLRIGIIALCLGFALLLPYFAYLMGFIGSSITLTMCLILPCSFHLKLRYKSLKWYQIFVDALIIICSVICFGAGSYFSFESIYYDWENGSFI